jgi:hypothetical protein
MVSNSACWTHLPIHSSAAIAFAMLLLACAIPVSTRSLFRTRKAASDAWKVTSGGPCSGLILARLLLLLKEPRLSDVSLLGIILERTTTTRKEESGRHCHLGIDPG